MNKKQAKQLLSRREFLGTAAAAAAVTIVPRHVLGGAKFVAPSEKVNIAIIGVGGQGRTNVRNLFNEAEAQIIAVCDPAEQWDLSPFYYGGLGGRKPVKDEIEKHYSEKTPNYKVAEYTDFRKMFDQAKDVDAVLIATPDHVHAIATITAMKAGKHVYCEKPLTHNIWEARLVAKVAKETGVATQ
ncbi:MAG: Gfo/Idh/MocA family protein, partial [Bacillota bacterium]